LASRQQAAAAWARNPIGAFTPLTAPIAEGGVAKLPPRGWAPSNFAIVLLTEFARAPGWADIDLSGHLPATPAALQAELDELASLVEFRAGVLAEAVAQRNKLPVWWCGALGYGRGSHPCTFYLTQAVLEIAQFQAHFHKNKHQRPRPSQLSPALLPPIEVPGHAAFPSGHSTEAHSLSLCLTEVFTRAAAINPPRPVVPSQPDSLDRLAQRIARNREVLGLHYPSDSAAGKALAQHTVAIMATCPTIDRLMTAAAAEWREYL
jgi:hypothetical protein